MIKVIAVVLLLSTIVCCTTMYVPTMQAVPMFEKKGDLQATLSTKNFQLAYAPTNQIGFFIDAYNKNGKPFVLSDDKAGNWHARSYAVEGALGIFQTQESFDLELFAGYGQGFSSISYWEHYGGKGTIKGGSSSFTKYFVQPNIIFGASYLKGVLALRVSSLNFYDFLDYSHATVTSKAIFFEPSFTLRKKIDFMSLKMQLQYSAVGSDFSDHNSRYVPYKSSALLFLSIDIHLNDLFYPQEQN